MIVSNPVVSSMRSKQTGHVGNSIRDGVGGGTGFADNVEGARLDETLPDPNMDPSSADEVAAT